MPTTKLCPRCQKELQADSTRPGSFGCAECGGTFSGLENAGFDLLHSDEDDSAKIDEEKISCPNCRIDMNQFVFDEIVLDKCPQCKGYWFDAGELPAETSAISQRSDLSRFLFYSLSLPERTVRSTVGLAAGAAKEAAELLVPQSFQSSKTYEIVLKNSLKFLTEDIGGVEGEKTNEADGAKNFAARKAVGNFIDMAGWATLAVSPVWMMAIVSDIAYGTKTYTQELAGELKKQGLIDEDSTINDIEDVLSAVQTTTGRTASMIDTPPLSVEELKKSLDETKQAITSADLRQLLPEAEIKKYWQEMKDISTKENVSLIGVSGALTMHTLGKVGTVGKGTLTGVGVVGGLFNKHVIGHYSDAIKQVHERGLYQSVKESSEPYVEALWNNFSEDRETWTEKIVSGKVFQSAYGKLSGWLRTSRKEDTDEATPPLSE